MSTLSFSAMTPGDDNLEIERKYLLRALPPVDGAPSVVVDQGYVPGATIRERVRRMRHEDGTERYVRTIKLGKGMARQEFEEETTREIFDALWAITGGKRLRKRRYFVADGDVTWEIDEFLDRELVLAEVEIPSVDYEVRIPGWLAPYLDREVTDDPAYGNHALAR